MNGKNSSFKIVIMLTIIGIIVFGIIYFGITLTKDLGKTPQNVTKESAIDALNKLYNDITVNKVDARKGQVNLNPNSL